LDELGSRRGLGGEDLERDDAAVALPGGLVHDSHPAAADYAEDFKVGKLRPLLLLRELEQAARAEPAVLEEDVGLRGRIAAGTIHRVTSALCDGTAGRGFKENHSKAENSSRISESTSSSRSTEGRISSRSSSRSLSRSRKRRFLRSVSVTPAG